MSNKKCFSRDDYCQEIAVGLLLPPRSICGWDPIAVCEEHGIEDARPGDWVFCSFETLSGLVWNQVPLNERLDDLQKTIHGLEGEVEHLSAHLMGHDAMGHRGLDDHYHGADASIRPRS